MKKRLLTLVCIIVSLFVVSIPTKAATPTTWLKSNKTKVYLAKSQTVQLKGYKLSGTIKWSTGNKSIATVTQKGVIKGLKAGKTTVTAKTRRRTYKCSVTVMDISKTALSLKKGSYKTISIKNGYAVVWTSSNTKVAKVAAGKITAVGFGKATISAKTRGRVMKCTVNVPNVTYSASELTMIGGVGITTASVSTAYGQKAPVYTSSNQNVATVSPTGQIMAVGAGVTNITANVDGLTYTQPLKVIVPDVGVVRFLSLLNEYNTYVKEHGSNFFRAVVSTDVIESFDNVKALIEQTPVAKTGINCNMPIRWAFDEFEFNYTKIWGLDKTGFETTYKGDMTYYLDRYTNLNDTTGIVGKTFKEAIDQGLMKPGDICCFEGLTHTFTYTGNGYLFYDGGQGAELKGYSNVGFCYDYYSVVPYRTMKIAEVLRWKE